MSYQDKSLKFTDCGTAFIFTTDAQNFYASKGLTSDPKRCAQCRASRNTQRGDDGDYGYRCRSWR